MKKRVISLLLMLALMVSLVACGTKDKETSTPTSEELFKSIADALKDVKEIDADMKVDVVAAMVAEGTSIELSLNADAALQLKAEENKEQMFAKFSYAVSMMGQNMSDEYEMYIIADEDNVNAYMKESGSWTSESTTRSEILSSIEEMLAEPDIKAALDQLKSGDFSKESEMDVSDVKIESEGSNYVISQAVNYEELMESLPEASTDYVEAESLEMLKGMSFECKIYVNKDSKLPTKITFDILSEETIEVEGMELSLDKANITMNFNKFSGVKDIVVPDEAKAAE